MGISARAVSYWLRDRHLPLGTAEIESALFGKRQDVDELRAELRQALQKTRSSKISKRPETSPQPDGTERSASDGPANSGGAVATPSDADVAKSDSSSEQAGRPVNLPVLFVAAKPEPKPETIELKPGNGARQTAGSGGAARPNENAGKDQKSRGPTSAIPTASAGAKKAQGAPYRSSRKTFYGVAAGFVLVLGGYGWTQLPSRPGGAVVQTTPPPPVPQPDPPVEPLPGGKGRGPGGGNGDGFKPINGDEDIRRDALTSFKLRDNVTVSGQTIGGTITLTEADCAVACNRSRCDGWAFNKNGPLIRGAYRSCLRFAAPLTFTQDSNYVSGQRIPEPDAPKPINVTVLTEPVVPKPQPGQVTGAEAPVEKDRVHCAGRYFVMPGFKLTCGQMLTDGTSPGPGPSSFIVGTAMECMAKCKPVENCVGFTYDVAEKSVQHICRIFGPTPNTVTSAGWLRAVRDR
nr:PAN domain-containing protein [Rhodopseudomonas sp. BR0C11]